MGRDGCPVLMDGRRYFDSAYAAARFVIAEGGCGDVRRIGCHIIRVAGVDNLRDGSPRTAYGHTWRRVPRADVNALLGIIRDEWNVITDIPVPLASLGDLPERIKRAFWMEVD